MVSKIWIQSEKNDLIFLSYLIFFYLSLQMYSQPTQYLHKNLPAKAIPLQLHNKY